MAITYVTHGIALWLAWGLFSIVQFGVNRYGKGLLHGYYMWIHRIIGTLIMLTTLFFGLWAYRDGNWDIEVNYHAYFVFPVLFLVFFIAVGGVATRSIMRRLTWKTKTALRIKRGHKCIAYLITLSGAAGVAAGIYYYYDYPPWNDGYNIRFFLHMGFFVVMCVLLEVLHQCRLRNEHPFLANSAKVGTSISVADFKSRVANGEQLVILDDLVLDVSKYLDDHPGGTFSLQNNIGRDVSKFFYGGYSQENEAGLPPHTHSSIARSVAEKMIIGRLVDEANRRLMKISCKEQDANSSGNTKAVKFVSVQSSEYQKISNSDEGCAIADYSMIAKHYLVKSTSHQSSPGSSQPGSFEVNKPGIRRHYTEAFCMRNDVYQSLLSLNSGGSPMLNSSNADNTSMGAPMSEDQALQKLREAIAENNSESVCLSIKAYSQNPGLSSYIHDDIEKKAQVFEITGPMGKGLNIQPTGEHIAFSAGTGVLVFIDLVAHLVLRIYADYEDRDLGDVFSSPKIDLKSFKFVLYTSFASEEEAIGLDLINTLTALCQKHDLPELFVHHSRIRNRDSSRLRWTKEFFTDKVKEAHAQGAKNLWVCGPPIMQEQCDKAIYYLPASQKQFVTLL